MGCRYSGKTWFYLLGQIVVGAARSVVVKLAYQGGFRAPLTVTLLSLAGKAIALPAHWLRLWLVAGDYAAVTQTVRDDGDGNAAEGVPPQRIELAERHNEGSDEDGVEDSTEEGAPPSFPTTPVAVAVELAEHHGEGGDGDANAELDARRPRSQNDAAPQARPMPGESDAAAVSDFYTATLAEDPLPRGSRHGLSAAVTARTVSQASRVPFYVRPALSAACSLLGSALRWTSVVHVDASIAEMLITGSELIFSVIAARILRRRMVACSRWVGVIIVALGLIVIERANSRKEEGAEDAVHGLRDVSLGVVLILLQSTLAALQDLSEEVFMQATDFPAAMLLGIEGAYGFGLGLVLYVTVGLRLQMEDIGATFAMLSERPALRWWFVGLPLLFLVAGLFNIKATEVTSAMTRNVWKTMRTVVVWAAALFIYYVGKDKDFGEAWYNPESFVILFGFMVMSSGIMAYYMFP